MRRSREQRCGNSGWEQRPNQTNAARASHPSRTHVISCACPITAKQRNDRFSPNRARSNAERRFCRSQLPIRHLSITIHQPSQWPAILSCSEEQIGEEAATPGQPVRACARFLDFPPAQFTLQNHRLRLTLPQSFRKLRKLHVSLDPLSARSGAPRNTKTSPPCEEAVEDETSLWKNEENREVLQFCKQLPMRSQSLPCGQTIPRRSAMNRSCDYQALKTQTRLESSHQYRHCPEMIPAHRLFLRKSLVPL